jgi:hypothetical protein
VSTGEELRKVPRVATWDSPWLIVGVLLFFTALLALVLVSAPNAAEMRDLGRSLITELLGFLFTAGAVGWFFNRHQQARRAEVLSRQRTVAARQVERVNASMAPLMAGGTSLGPQYLSDFTKTTSALEHLDADCAEVISTSEVGGDEALEWAHFRDQTRQLTMELLSLQATILGARPRGSTALPSAIADLIQNWKAKTDVLGLADTSRRSSS